MSLTPERLARIDKALSTVIERADEFDHFQVDFAFRNADRIDRYGVKTVWTEKQWGVVERIETRIRELDEGGARGAAEGAG